MRTFGEFKILYKIIMTLFRSLWNFNFQESTEIRFEKVKVFESSHFK
jgi:hypothetical protein